MARFQLEGLDTFNRILHELGTIPDDVLDEAVAAMGEAAKQHVKAVGEQMRVRDPESSVHILDNIALTKPKKTDFGAYTDVTFRGKRKRGNTTSTNAEIAFINEFGHRGQPARPFIKTTAEQYADAIAAPGEKIIGDWFEKTVQNS